MNMKLLILNWSYITILYLTYFFKKSFSILFFSLNFFVVYAKLTQRLISGLSVRTDLSYFIFNNGNRDIDILNSPNFDRVESEGHWNQREEKNKVLGFSYRNR